MLLRLIGMGAFIAALSFGSSAVALPAESNIENSAADAASAYPKLDNQKSQDTLYCAVILQKNKEKNAENVRDYKVSKVNCRPIRM